MQYENIYKCFCIVVSHIWLKKYSLHRRHCFVLWQLWFCERAVLFYAHSACFVNITPKFTCRSCKMFLPTRILYAFLTSLYYVLRFFHLSLCWHSCNTWSRFQAMKFLIRLFCFRKPSLLSSLLSPYISLCTLCCGMQAKARTIVRMSLTQKP